MQYEVNMEHKKRACMAIISAAIINHKDYSNVFDYSTATNSPIQVNIMANGYISAFDYSRGGYISGNTNNLFDYITSSYININVVGQQIRGFDYYSAKYFLVIVTGNAVSLYDHETNQWYYYTVT